MNRYYLGLAITSLKRTPWLSLLMILSLAVGIAASMATMTLRYALGRDPLPGKSERLLSVRDPTTASRARNTFSYGDASLLAQLASSDAVPVISAAGITNTLSAAGSEQVLEQGVGIRYATRHFFDVFDVPLRRGRTWTAQEEASAAPVVVIEQSTARDLFHGADPIGKQLLIGDTQYTVIGLTGHWNPQPRYYDLEGVAGAFGGGGDAIFVPVTAMRYAPENLMVSTACPGRSTTPSSPPQLLSSQCRWLQVWLLARDSAQAHALRRSVAGRLPLVLSAKEARGLRLMNVHQILTHADVIPAPVRLYATIGIAFLILCSINASGMQLSRVLRTSSQIGIRRALGATRPEIIKQYLFDSLLVCGIGGVLGMALTFLGLHAVRHLPDLYYTGMAHMDGTMFSLMVALVVASGTLIGVIPAWLASRVDPALLIKVPQ